VLKDILTFIIHLRPHYQVLVLSGGYLLGGLMSAEMHHEQYWLQFLNIHLLLFGGATAYNSFWDKDEGPVGGLRNPPAMKKWMHPVSLLIQLAGFVFAFSVGFLYSLIYLFSFFLFWIYSTPIFRWKGRPVLSLFVIAISTGANSVLAGTLAAGGQLSPVVFVGAAGAALILTSLYPVSQIFQLSEDKKRGDVTYAVKYGKTAVKTFFRIAFLAGLILTTLALYNIYVIPSLLFGSTGFLAWIFLNIRIKDLHGFRDEYEKVMKIKFTASLSFVIFLMISILIIHGNVNMPLIKDIFK